MYQYGIHDINQPLPVKYLRNSWKGNLENGTQLSPDQVYENGKILHHKAAALYKVAKDLFEQANKLEGSEENVAFINKNRLAIKNLLNSVGISVTTNDLNTVLTNFQRNKEEVHDITNMGTILEKVARILNGASIASGEQSIQEATDLPKNHSEDFKVIAEMFGKLRERTIEDSVHENGKGY
jgi:hypothetical protein